MAGRSVVFPRLSLSHTHVLISFQNGIFYNVPGTRVTLNIDSSKSAQALSDRDTLMCIIEATDAMNKHQSDDPLEDGSFSNIWSGVLIKMEDRGSPQGRFMYDIAAHTVRGMAEWMTANDAFRELVVEVYFNRYYCGRASISNIATENSRTATSSGDMSAGEAVVATPGSSASPPS